ncbi:aldo/keto reductase [Nocardiopsis protaetiae]|uniref:aldo/keto reductase n=1 Tax=Nocardiopsis protaetiae TaxID=3382270 RepID=UPI00387B022F
MTQNTTNTPAPHTAPSLPPVSRIGLGTMRFADAPHQRAGATAPVWNAPTDRDTLTALLHRALDLGIDHFDTADAYALGEGERLIGEALRGSGATIATKIGVTRPSPTEWVPLGHPAYLRQQVEASLRRLGTDTIDLLYLHRVDPDVPVEDQVEALAQAQREGKAQAIGLSEVDVPTLERAHAVTPISAVQNLYNHTARDHDPVVDRTAELGIAFVPFFPVAMGESAAASPVAEIAAETGATPVQVQLAWLLRRGAHILPIPGTTSADHLAENAAAARLELSDDQVRRLNARHPSKD